MNKTKKQNNLKRIVSAHFIIWPAVTSVVLIHIVMVISIYNTNILNEKLAHTLQKSAEYVEEISNFMGGASLLNETSSSFVVNPIDGEGNVIWGQIAPFAVEISTNHRRAEDLLASFSDYNVSNETIGFITEACDSATYFLNTQLHAIALVTSVYPLPSMPQLEPIAHLEITEEEANMPEGARLSLAKSLVLNKEYGQHRQRLSTAVSEAIGSIKNSSAKDIQETNRKVSQIKIILWISVILAVAILTIAFLNIYFMLVYPLAKSSKLILRNKRLDENHGLRELRVTASSYNDLLKRRDRLEKLLKEAAETDILTHLPNRYAFEQYIRSLRKDENIYPLCYYIFDINYLKITNDTYGHRSGDRLLENSAKIINDCFGSGCFRIGGDEFVAIIKNYSEEKALEIEKKFHSLLEKEEISISFGNSITNDLNTKTIKQMMIEADHMMYDRKRIIHETTGDGGSASCRNDCP